MRPHCPGPRPELGDHLASGPLTTTTTAKQAAAQKAVKSKKLQLQQHGRVRKPLTTAEKLEHLAQITRLVLVDTKTPFSQVNGI